MNFRNFFCYVQKKCSSFNKIRIIILLGLEVLANNAKPIGTPSAAEGAAGSSAAPAAAQASASKPTPSKPAPAPSSAAPVKTPVKTQAPPAAAKPAPAAAASSSKPIQQNANKGAGNRKSAPAAPMQISEQNVQPISSLNPYQPNWVIKARIIAKSQIKEWSKQDKKGKLFSIDLQDSDGTKIRCIFFNDLVDQYADQLQEDHIYYIARGHLKFANKQFSNIPNDFEISADQNTQIVPAQDDGSIQRGSYEYIRLSDVKTAPETCSVVGIIDKISAVAPIKTKAGKTIVKRAITLLDNVNDNVFSVECTVWDKRAENFSFNVGDVITISNVKKSNFGGISLSANAASNFQKVLNEDADTLRTWYEGYKDNRSGASVNSLTTTFNPKGGNFSKRKMLIEAKDMGHDKDPSWLTCNATVTFIKNDNNLYYPACPTIQGNNEQQDGTERVTYCNKKMTKQGEKWHCDNCHQDHDTCNYKYMMSLVINDCSGSKWVTAFDKQAYEILGYTAADLADMVERNEADQVDKIVQAAFFKEFVMKLKIKAEPNMQGDGERVRCNLFSATPLNYADESKRLLDEIKRYEAL